MSVDPPAPLVLIAELTHRCPLRCAYCSNPRALAPGAAELGTADWRRVLEQAAALGVLQVHLTGGEPLVRDDLEDIAVASVAQGLYTTLVTSGLGPHALRRLDALVRLGVRAVQVSFQDTDDAAATAVAGRAALRDKLAFARRTVERGASLTTNFVLHRGNLSRLERFLELSLALGADRVELAHVQIHGWARLNRAALLPTAAEVQQAERLVTAARLQHGGALEILHVRADHHSNRPKPCMAGWGRRAIVVSPDGALLPCHGATELPLTLDRVPDRSLADAWAHGEAFAAFRGEAWMEAPCRSCPERGRDFGGCRCQALALTGRATATDPACARSPHHELIRRLRRGAERVQAMRPEHRPGFVLRRPPSASRSDPSERDLDHGETP